MKTLSLPVWLMRPNAQYVLAFLRNSGERVRAIRFVMDAANLSMKDAEAVVRMAWRKQSNKKSGFGPETVMGDGPMSMMQPGDEI